MTLMRKACPSRSGKFVAPPEELLTATGRKRGGPTGAKAAPMTIDERIDGVHWSRLTSELNERGWATTGPLLTDEERSQLIASYERDPLFRSAVRKRRISLFQLSASRHCLRAKVGPLRTAGSDRQPLA